MPIQLAVLSHEENRAAWGPDWSTAAAVVETMNQEARGLDKAKTIQEIADGAEKWVQDMGQRPIAQGFQKKKVPSVLHKLSQGVAHAALRRSGQGLRYYVHADSEKRLAEERDLAGTQSDMWQHSQQQEQYAAETVSLKPCATPGCPYGGAWESPSGGTGVTYPDGPKCCGCCTGRKESGKPMPVAHGNRCMRDPWLGTPNLAMDKKWMSVICPSQLNELVHKAYGSARLVQNELDARDAGVTLQWSYPTEWVGGAPVQMCHLDVVKNDETWQWSVSMSGPTRQTAKLRAQLAFLHAYNALLAAAADGPPVDYPQVWLAATEELAQIEADAAKVRQDKKNAFADKEARTNQPDPWHVAFAARAEVQQPQPEPLAPAGDGAPDMWGTALAPAYPGGCFVTTTTPGEIWGPGVAGLDGVAGQQAGQGSATWNRGVWRPQPGFVATRPMCAVARYETSVFAWPRTGTKPSTKIVPVSELRAALEGVRKPTLNLDDIDDEELIRTFLRDLKPRDTKSHGGIPRFARALLDPSTMYPGSPHARSRMLVAGVPCLVVRLKRDAGH